MVLYIRDVKGAFGPLPDSGHGWRRHTADKWYWYSAGMLKCGRMRWREVYQLALMGSGFHFTVLYEFGGQWSI